MRYIISYYINQAEKEAKMVLKIFQIIISQKFHKRSQLYHYLNTCGFVYVSVILYVGEKKKKKKAEIC